MAQKNQIAMKVPETDLASIRAAVATLNTLLRPLLSGLTPQERQEIPKMGDKTAAFVRKAQEYGRLNPDLVPPFLDLTDWDTDLEAIQVLQELRRSLHPLVEALEDSITLSGSEAYQAALVFYASVKTAARANIGNAALVYEDLSERFPGRSTRRS